MQNPLKAGLDRTRLIEPIRGMVVRVTLENVK